jgi:hypothetical protein
LTFISCDKIEDKAVQAMLALPQLKVIDIREGGSVTDAAFANFACNNLETLVLVRGKITDASK